MAEADMFFYRIIQNGRTDGATLGDECQLALEGHAGGKGGIESGGRAHDTQTVGADDSDLAARCRLTDPCLMLSAAFACFFTARRDHHRTGGFDASAIGDDLRYGFHGGRHHHQIQRTFHVVQGG